MATKCSEYTTVKIRTPARLHFSLIDLNGELGRVDGGLGVAIDKPNWGIEISKHSKWSFPPEITQLLQKIRNNLPMTQSYKVDLKSKLPLHMGLGSQTQLALALAQGLSILEDQRHSITELAGLVGRGGTSGIGIAAYEHGGFILDGGHTRAEKPEFSPSHFSKAKPALLINRFKVPKDWYFVVAIPNSGAGKHGLAEVEIFNKYCPIPSTEVEKLSRIILMQMLPGIIENDIEHFGDGLTRIQNVGFKRIENKLQTKFVQGIQRLYLDQGAAGTGLSSFGPATFCVVGSKSTAQGLVREAEKYLKKHGFSGKVFLTQANNSGAKIEAE